MLSHVSFVPAALALSLAAVQSRAEAPPEWAFIDRAPAAVLQLPALARPAAGRTAMLVVASMAKRLATAPVVGVDVAAGRLSGPSVSDSTSIIELPTPEGGVERFRFVESPVLPPDMQAKYPDIRTYIGQGLDNPAATVHFDLTPLGFHAQVFTPTSRGRGLGPMAGAAAWYIDPVSRGDTQHYAIYRHGDLPDPGPGGCETVGEDAFAGGVPLGSRGPTGDVQLRVLRLAVAATGEYTAWHSLPDPPSQDKGIAAVTTAVNRINQIFMRDLAVQFMLAANNNAIIFANATTDPFTPPAGSPLGTVPVLNDVQPQNQTVVSSTIAPGTWDLGHCVHATPTGAGFSGRASIGGVCGPLAATAASTSGLPDGTYFWISLLAHEIGHQLGGTHTFNGTAGTCGNAGQYTSASAIEPGSGTTIMSYAGNCDSDNIVTHNPTPAGGGLPQSGALQMFGAYNIDQIGQWLAVHTCGLTVSTGNRRPFAPLTGVGSWVIPANTPFRLNTTAGDPDAGQSVSVSWEQFNIGAQRSLGPDTGAFEPLFRTFDPSSDPERIFPALQTVLGFPALRGENLPRFDRTMFFRAVSRDNYALGGGVAQSQVTVGVWRTPNDAAFRVLAPAGGSVLCAGQVLSVQWDPVGTAGPPVNAAAVDITLSLDGGQTWPIALAAGVPNSGQATVTVPGISTSNGRIKVEAVNNIFFNINSGNLIIASGPPSVGLQPQDVSVCPGQAASLRTLPGPNLANVQWFRDGIAITGATSMTLAFANAQPSDSGNYWATLTNGCGEVTTRTARLQVGVSMDNLTGMPSAPVAPCSPIVAQAQARGTGPLTYRWYRNGAALTDVDGITGSSTSTLTLPGARFALEGAYEVRITDPCGERAFAAGELRVAGPFWAQKSVTPAPGGGGQASAYWISAYDESRGVLVMYGGLDNNGRQSNSLYEYNGSSWVARYDGSAVPLAQPFAGQEFFDGFVPPYTYISAYSPDHQAIYMVGCSGDSYPMRIWRWDGTSYTTVANRPGSGNGYSLLQAAYDRLRHRLVIVRVSGNLGPAEVLDFDPSTGTITPGPVPPQPNSGLLYGSKLYYDEARQACILYQPAGNFNPAAVYAYNGAWSTLSGTPLNLWWLTPMTYDPVRRQGVALGASELGPACGQWYTGTFTFPGSTARFAAVMPLATDVDIPLPDGAPRNPAGAGQSPDNAFSCRMIAFDRRRNAMIAVGGRGMSSFTCGTPTWDMWERRYLDAPAFDVQPPGSPQAQGQTLTLTATPAGAATLTLRWRRNGAILANGALPGFPGTTVSGATTSTLTITGPDASAAAAYRLEAINGCGSVFSNSAVIGTLPPADFNQDGAVSVQDIFDFLAAYFTGGPAADFNHSGTVTVQDIFDFLAAYFGG